MRDLQPSNEGNENFNLMCNSKGSNIVSTKSMLQVHTRKTFPITVFKIFVTPLISPLVIVCQESLTLIYTFRYNINFLCLENKAWESSVFNCYSFEL